MAAISNSLVSMRNPPSHFSTEPTILPSMAETTSASTSTTISSTSTSNSINLTNQPLLLLSNMSNMMTVKLDSSNYIVWKHQISMVLETYSMIELLDEVSFVPEKFLKDLSGATTSILNPDYLIWKSKEKALLTFISSTLTPSVLAITVGCSSAQEVWKVLENRFSSISRSHVMNLKGELHNVKKGSDTVDAYLQKIKVIRDKLMAVGVFLDDEELLHVAIKGLPKEFSAFRSAIRTRSTKLSFDELATLLNAEEESLNEGMEVKDSTFAMAVNTAPRFNNSSGFHNHNQSYNRGRGRNHNGRGRGRGSSPNQFNQFTPHSQFSQSSSNVKSERPICQICGKAGHLALDCYHRMDYAYQGKHPPTKLAAMATSSNSMITQEQPWLADSAATDHVTSSLSHLNFPKPYTGQEHLTVGNGQNLPITHIGPALKPLDQFLGNASFTNLFLNTNRVGKLRLCSSRKPLIVQAGYSDRGRPGSASIFVGGFVLGGLIFGTLSCVYAPQISKALAGPERKDLMKKLPKFIYDEDKALEKTRKELAKKIAQLNSAIDDVSGQLQSDEAPNGANVISDEIEAAI